ncbi:MAG TPA: SMP-30/gluconolactonase/LRE family protein [Chitinophagaceae bacterium]|nr:SMP-30/gluconolactonase/LRE family protein [Chitinophagaceae bacterium]
MKKLLIYLPALLLFSCNDDKQTDNPKEVQTKYKTIGSLEKIDPSLDSIISPAAQAEIIAEGFDWSEGPVWVESHKMLLFSDVPRDTVFKWTEEKGKEVYLTPSGYTDTIKRGGEMGSNGLVLDKDGHLILCQHGNRQMAKMDAPLDNPQPKYISLANSYKGKKLNSPNDAVYNGKGELFFTDPPYGLEKNVDDPKKEIPFQGVYSIKTDGETVLMTDSITRPNGIALMPGEKMVVVANSDPEKPNWYAFDIDNNGNFSNGRVFYSAAGQDKSQKGLPDGFKIDKNGNVFATGPGGIWILNRDGKLLGKYKLTEASSNCAFSPDEKTLYITNDMYVLRLKMR